MVTVFEKKEFQIILVILFFFLFPVRYGCIMCGKFKRHGLWYSTDQLIVKLWLSFCYLFAIFLTAFAIYDRNLFVFKQARNLKLAIFRNLT